MSGVDKKLCCVGFGLCVRSFAMQVRLFFLLQNKSVRVVCGKRPKHSREKSKQASKQTDRPNFKNETGERTIEILSKREIIIKTQCEREVEFEKCKKRKEERKKRLHFSWNIRQWCARAPVSNTTHNRNCN